MTIVDVLPWVLSVQSAVMLWLMGDGNRYGAIVGLLGQALWIWYVLLTSQWGLVPGVILFILVNGRNCYKMRR